MALQPLQAASSNSTGRQRRLGAVAAVLFTHPQLRRLFTAFVWRVRNILLCAGPISRQPGGICVHELW